MIIGWKEGELNNKVLHVKEIMSQVLEEVEKAISRLGLTDEVSLLRDEGSILYKSLLSHFVEGSDRRWWWEALSHPSESITYEDGKGFEQLSQFVPDPREVVWFMVEDNQLPSYPIFEASTVNVIKIIGVGKPVVSAIQRVSM